MENMRGALLMVASMLGFAAEDAFIKLMTADLPIGQVILVLGALGTGVFAVAARARGEALFARDLLRWPLLLRSFCEFAAACLYISAIALTPLAQASAIQQALPLVVTMGAALFMGERVGWRRWSAIGVGFAGVLVVIHPGTEGFSALSLLSLGSVFWLALRDLVTRTMPPTVSALQIAVWGFAALLPAGGLLLALQGDSLQPMDGMHWGWAVGGSVFGVLGYYALIGAVRVGEMSVVTPFRYSRLIFAVLIGWIAFGEAPTIATLAGGALIVGSGLYTLWRQTVAMRAEGRQSRTVRR